ncbi:MAG: hypothetical protein KF746_23340 [Chitinophagaceae bacterium]|nr:hypothetical protein [Chitinophagaceae bacterium]
MHPKLDILLKWEIDTIDFYFENGLANFIKEINNADDTMILPDLSNKDLAIGSFRYFRQSVLYELNALVEHFLQIAAASDDALLKSNKNLKRSRNESVKIIMEKYNISIQNLTGYAEIKVLYSTVNALKHRGGFEYTDFSKIIPEFKIADCEINTLKELKAATFQFMKELVNSILLKEKK